MVPVPLIGVKAGFLAAAFERLLLCGPVATGLEVEELDTQYWYTA